MPYESEAQRRLMEGIRHGMKPRMKNSPSRAVAEKFHNEDKQRRMAQFLRKKY